MDLAKAEGIQAEGQKTVGYRDRSPLYKGYKSVMLFAGIKERKFKDEVFTLTFIPNLESLR